MKKLIWICFSLLIFLSGCVRYDLGVDFQNANRGTIIQHIKLEEQLTSFSQVEAKTWLNNIEARAQKLQGTTKKISPQEIIVSIPFSNGQNLVSKFNRFFEGTTVNKKSDDQALDLLDLKATMSINQSNLLFVERNVLNINADLSSLGVVSEEGNVIVSSGNLIDVELNFNFPWGAKLVNHELSPPGSKSNHQLVWQLQPGQVNQITTIFWLPNYVGLGTVAIALLILLGFYLKYQQLPLISKRTG
jgi:hypothetical protein